jgi:DUF4097 and DUF4098 domain-containing protein YvlB
VRTIVADARIWATNGRINATGLSGNTTMTVSNGQIHASASVSPGGELDLDATNGLIDLKIPEETSAEFYANVGNGTITITNLELKDQTTTPHSVTGTLGIGAGTITVHVTNGTIVVRGT